MLRYHLLFSGKGVIAKGVFSLEESLKSLNPLESLRNGQILLSLPQSGALSKKWTSLKGSLFQKTPFFRTRNTLFPSKSPADELR